MREPKFILVFESEKHYPFVIYEQVVMAVDSISGIHQRNRGEYSTLELALLELSILNENEPILLTYSSKPIDNVVDLRRN